jgi:fimbrial isopeptide formation D2 family protein/LPXTG-motif cell wall-anchored protein
MKRMKKFMALVIAMAMMLTMMSMTAFAADPTITITAPENHKYEIYQVFTGVVKDGELTSLKYGQNAVGYVSGAVTAVSQADMTKLQAIQDKTYTTDQQKIADLVQFVNFESEPIKTVDSGTASDSLAPGYYVIKDVDAEIPEDEGATLYMFRVLNEDLSTSAKSDKPSSDKSVEAKDHNAADYNIGDTIPYTLTFTLPSDYANFKAYYVEFNDSMDDGLTYNADAKIYYGASDTTGEAIDMGPDVQTAGATLQYVIEDLKTGSDKQKALTAGDVITIEYTAYLNDDAKIGSTGNKNEYSVKFSRNPNQDGSGTPETSETPKDTNIVFSYQTIFNKVDEDGNELEGADFLLEKKIDGQWVDVTELNTSANPKKIGKSSDKDTTFSFEGLDAGEYRLTESYTPAGYNTMDPIEFTITAELNIEAGDSTALENLFSTGLVMTSDVAAGSLTTSIENQSGVVLPSTGGIGTTIFYIVGAILVVGAGVVLITRRRMEA